MHSSPGADGDLVAMKGPQGFSFFKRISASISLTIGSVSYVPGLLVTNTTFGVHRINGHPTFLEPPGVVLVKKKT